MTQLSWWWTTDDTGDGPVGGYTIGQTARFYRMWTQPPHAGGVWPDFENMLAVSGTASPVQVATGGALVYGFGYASDAVEDVAIPTPAANTRIDRIVLRLTWAAEQVRIHRIAGSEGAGPPALTQNAGTTWDVPLAQVSITTGGVITVTDERPFITIVGDGNISTAKLAALAVTNAKLAADAVSEVKILNGSVSTNKLANGAVTSDKLGAKAVTNTKLRDSTALSVLGRSANTNGEPADIVAANDGQVLRRAGTALGFGQVATAGLADSAVTTAKVTDGAIAQAKLGTDTLRQLVIPIWLDREIRNGNSSFWLNMDGSATSAPPERGFIWFDKSRLPAGATVKFSAVFRRGDAAGTAGIRLQRFTGGADAVIPGTTYTTDSTTLGNSFLSDDIAAHLPAELIRLFPAFSAPTGTSAVLGHCCLIVEW